MTPPEHGFTTSRTRTATWIRTRRRLLCALAIAVLAGAGLVWWPTGPGRPDWQDLRDPASTVGAGTGQIIGQAGGTGPQEITLLGGPTRGTLTIAIVCRGSGRVSFTAGTKSLGGGDCFAEQPVSFSTTTPVTSLPFWIDVDAPDDVDWRVSMTIA